MALTDSLVSWWKLGEATGSGDRADAHGSHPLSPVNTSGSAVSVTQGTGHVGSCAQFSGSNSLLHAAHADFNIGDEDFTIAVWFYLPAAAADTTYVPAAKYGNTLTDGEWELVVRKGAGQNDFYFQLKTGVTNPYVIASADAVTFDAWHYLVAWHDAAANQIGASLDNATALTAGTSGEFPSDHTGSFLVGARTYALANFPSGGRVDEVAFWTRALTSGERTTLWNGGSGVTYEDISGPTTSLDLSGPNGATSLPSNHNGNITLTLVGTGTLWQTTPPTFTVSGVTGWAKVSQNVTSETAATVVVSCPAVASPPSGATGTLTVSDGTLADTLAVATPTLTLSPDTGSTGGSASTTATGTHTLWQGDDPDLTLSGGTGASIGATTMTTNTAGSATVTYGAATATLTVTDPSTGAQDTLAVSAAGAGEPGDISVAFTQATTREVLGSYWESNATGALWQFEFQGTSLAVEVDTSAPVGAGAGAPSYAILGFAVDNAAAQYGVTNGGTDLGSNRRRLTLATGLSGGGAWHTAEVWADENSAAAERWTTLVGALRLRKFVASDGTALSATRAFTRLRPAEALFDGDSITESTPWDSANYRPKWPAYVAAALHCRPHIRAWQGQGWTVGGQGGVPAYYDPGDVAGSAWDKYSSGHARLAGGLIVPALAHWFVAYGTNDGITDVQAACEGWLGAARTAAPDTALWVVVPPSGIQRAALTAAVAAVGDANAYLLDVQALDPDFEVGLNQNPTASLQSPDGLHPAPGADAMFAALLVARLQALLAPAGGGGGPVTSHPGGGSSSPPGGFF